MACWDLWPLTWCCSSCSWCGGVHSGPWCTGTQQPRPPLRHSLTRYCAGRIACAGPASSGRSDPSGGGDCSATPAGSANLRTGRGRVGPGTATCPSFWHRTGQFTCSRDEGRWKGLISIFRNTHRSIPSHSVQLTDTKRRWTELLANFASSSAESTEASPSRGLNASWASCSSWRIDWNSIKSNKLSNCFIALGQSSVQSPCPWPMKGVLARQQQYRIRECVQSDGLLVAIKSGSPWLEKWKPLLQGVRSALDSD